MPGRAALARVALALGCVGAGPASLEEVRTPVSLEEVRALAVLDVRARELPPWQRARIASAVVVAARLHEVDPLLLLAVIERESRYRCDARGPGGRGLMQIGRAASCEVAWHEGERCPSVVELFEPGPNVRLGAAYLARMRREFGSWEAALTAYNKGPERFRNLRRRGHPSSSAYARGILALRAVLVRYWAPL